jgi:DNA-binding GntR family transcriptional regulator
MDDKVKNVKASPTLEPLGQVVQLGSRVYDSLVQSIASGQMDFGAPLRLNEIARMLEVSTTPVREALSRLESSGLAVKVPNCGWFVRYFSENEIRDLHEVRASIESLSVRLACARMTEEELDWLRANQKKGEAALQAGDANAYLLYNREFHSAIMRASRNSYLALVIGQLAPQSEMLTARSIKIAGRMRHAFDEHSRIVECLGMRDAEGAEKGMKVHILSALVEFLRLREESDVKRRSHNEIEEFLLGRGSGVGEAEATSLAVSPLPAEAVS